MSINIRFSPNDWDRIRQDWSAWWTGELDRPMVMIEDIQLPNTTVENIHSLDKFSSTFPIETPVDDVLDFYQTRLEAKRFYGDTFPKWNINLGAGIAAAYLGASPEYESGTIWFKPPKELSLAEIQPRFDPHNVWWQRTLALTRRAEERWGPQVCVGLADLGGNFDIFASLRTTQQLLFDLYDAPEEVSLITQEITHAWLKFYDELYDIMKTTQHGTTPWARIWSPGRCYMLQSDFAYMISPQMFEQFVMPDLAACCEKLDHGFYHLDGKGQIAHLDHLLSLPRLRGVQWIPGEGAPPPEEWLPLLKRIRDGGKLCQLYVTAEGARKIVKEIGGRGFAFFIAERLSATDAQDYLNLLANEAK